MTPVKAARRKAQRATRADVLELPTRIGFVGYGLLHLAVGWLALQIAFGHRGQEGDQAGAFRVLAGQPFGRILLIATIVGLAAMAVWQLLLAAGGHRAERGFRRSAERLASLGRSAVYAVLAWTAGRVVAGASTSNAAQQQKATAGVLAHAGGRWLVGLAGLAVVALGVGFVVYGSRRMFEKRLRIARMSPAARRAARWLGRTGYVAKGIAFAIVGLLLADAAVTDNPARSRGLDAALRTLATQPYGVVLLSAVALGFAAFGVYCLFQVRYRKMSA